jgi:GntR family transcriptional regulator, transcriptional repressor for pyruvate dehydrogenase complex
VLKGILPLARSTSSRAEELVRRIESLVAEIGAGGRARLGSKEELRQQFQVAHGTMNEAMRVLETRGLVELRRGANGGVFIGTPSVYVRLGNGLLGFRGDAGSIEHCLAVRNQLEPLVASEAAKVAAEKPDAIAELFEIVEKMRRAVDDSAESIRWNWQMHRRIAEMGRNGVLTGIYLALLGFIERELTDIKPTRSRSVAERIVNMHSDIVAAIATGDPKKAEEAAKKHPLPPEEDDGPSSCELHDRARENIS